MDRLAAAILIGGASKRFGSPKEKIIIDGDTQLSFLTELLENRFDKIYLSGRADQLSQYQDEGFIICPDQEEEQGPIHGIIQLLENNQSGVLVLAVDMPNLNKALISRLIEERNFSKKVTIYRSKGQLQPLCAIWEPGALESLKAFYQSGKRSLMGYLQQEDIEVLKESDSSLFHNVNHQDDLQPKYLSDRQS